LPQSARTPMQSVSDLAHLHHSRTPQPSVSDLTRMTSAPGLGRDSNTDFPKAPRPSMTQAPFPDGKQNPVHSTLAHASHKLSQLDEFGAHTPPRTSMVLSGAEQKLRCLMKKSNSKGHKLNPARFVDSGNVLAPAEEAEDSAFHSAVSSQGSSPINHGSSNGKLIIPGNRGTFRPTRSPGRSPAMTPVSGTPPTGVINKPAGPTKMGRGFARTRQAVSGCP